MVAQAQQLGSVAYPLVAIIGDVGTGKTLLGVDITRKFYAQFGETRYIFTNILLFDIPYIDVDFGDFNEDFTEKKYDLIINIKDENGTLFYKDVDKQKKPYRRDVLKRDIPFEDGLLVIDEAQEGDDAYKFLNRDVVAMNKFVSQVRKYDLELFVITQRLNFISARLRRLLNYHYEIDYYLYFDKNLGMRTFTTGIAKIKYFRLSNSGRKLYKKSVKDLRGNFPFYSTKQIVKERTKIEKI